MSCVNNFDMTVFSSYTIKSPYFKLKHTFQGFIQLSQIAKDKMDQSLLYAFKNKKVHFKF